MPSNLDRYKKDLDSLISKGAELRYAMELECFPEKFKAWSKKEFGDKAEEFFRTLPSFRETYKSWYSEAKALIRQLLPDRLSDFVRQYGKPKPRKEITNENYAIEDYLQGLFVTQIKGGLEKQVVGLQAAIPHFTQQRAILESVNARFQSSLFDIR